jgi:hypothetical protein
MVVVVGDTETVMVGRRSVRAAIYLGAVGIALIACGDDGSQAPGDDAGTASAPEDDDATDADDDDGAGEPADDTDAGDALEDADPAADGTDGDVCDLLEVDEVAELFGRAADEIEVTSEFGDDCGWRVIDETVDPEYQYFLYLQRSDEPALWDPEIRAFDEPVPISGLGDDAFHSYGDRSGVIVGVIEGSKTAHLSFSLSEVSIALDTPVDAAEGREDDVIELVRTVMTRW